MTDGISFLLTLFKNDQTEYHEYLYWEIPEHGEQQAMRIGHSQVQILDSGRLR
ncbi:hypothetical protein OAR31_00520 [Candidatus Marinimicrobia bacterium]|nr:hypothetical protein [Candidatus Neomarinimicrobiota bacterium]